MELIIGVLNIMRAIVITSSLYLIILMFILIQQGFKEVFYGNKA